MIGNSYIGMVPPEITRLIVNRARRYRVGRDEIDDLQQQIVPLLADFHFDPVRAHGASPATAMTGVIDRQIKAYLRAKRRYQQRIELLQGTSGDPDRQNTVPPAYVTQTDPVDLRIDLERTLTSFSPRDREICHGLSHGLTIKAIAEQLGCGRDTVDRAIARIRKAFETAGLRAWIDPNYRSNGQDNQQEVKQ